MKSTVPTSLVGFVKHVESILKQQIHFFVSYTRTQHDPATLKSMKLMEVRKPTSAGVSIIVEGVFDGRDGPHKFEASPDVLAACGLTALTIGMGAAPSTNGTVAKSMTLRICPTYVIGELAEEVAAMFRPSRPATRAVDLKPVTESKRYKEAVQDIADIDEQIRKLTQQRGNRQASLDRMLAQAQSVAHTSQHLPAKASTRRHLAAQ